MHQDAVIITKSYLKRSSLAADQVVLGGGKKIIFCLQEAECASHEIFEWLDALMAEGTVHVKLQSTRVFLYEVCGAY